MASVHLAPSFTVYKSGIDAVIAVADVPAMASAGLNFAGFDTAMFNIIPAGTGNPTIEIMVWSPAANKFVSANPVSTFAGVGADIPYHFTVPALGRVLYPRVSVLASGSVTIEAAGYRAGSI